MAFTKQSAGGEFFRINKVLLEIMKIVVYTTKMRFVNLRK